ncbi:MAG: DUF2619 domain-containing protein [Bacillaceae bacterium]
MKNWLDTFSTGVLAMAVLRLIGGSVELLTAIAMLSFNDIRKSIALNAMLAMIGPFILVSTMAIGLVSVAHGLSPAKFVLVAIGVTCILVGVFR